MAEGEEKEPQAADLALIAAAQKVEHYEISAYKTARTLAGQIGAQNVAWLLNTSLGEEETAESLLTQIARELMSESRTGISKDDELTTGRRDPGKHQAARAPRSGYHWPNTNYTFRRVVRRQLRRYARASRCSLVPCRSGQRGPARA